MPFSLQASQQLFVVSGAVYPSPRASNSSRLEAPPRSGQSAIMDLAYDHIASQSLPQDEEGKNNSTEAGQSSNQNNNTLNADFQAAYTALSASASPWASRIGGFFGNVVKQGESVYREAQQEVTALGQDASKGLTGLRETLTSRTRGLSLATITAPGASSSTDAAGETTPTAETSGAATRGVNASGEDEATVLARIKGEAAKRLRDLQRAEDAADEALIKFGTNLRDFLKEAITIAPPTTGTDAASGSSGEAGAAAASGSGGSTVLFESKDAQGKRVIHTSRFDAQLHVIHTTTDSFAKDPSANKEFAAWSTTFNIDAKTEDIAADLNKYPDLRATMEKLVPATIPYADFWKRYYFLRHGIETAEARRRDLLKAASAEEEIGWDEDSEEEEAEEEGDDDDDDDEDDDDDDEDDDDDSDSDDSDDSDAPTTSGKGKSVKRPGSVESSRTIQPPAKPTTAKAAAAPAAAVAAAGSLKPTASPRKSDEKSVADSEASYDVVGTKSGAPSQAPNSPQRVEEDSEEEDWE